MEGLSPLVSFLGKFNVNHEKLMIDIFPIIQEQIIAAIKPSEEQLLNWKNTEDGRKKFEQYLLSKFTVIPTQTIVMVLWNKFTGKKIKTRDRKIIDRYLQIHMHCKMCEHCGTSKGQFHVDHIIPLSQGGLDEISNLQFLCNSCNLRKSSSLDPFKAII